MRPATQNAPLPLERELLDGFGEILLESDSTRNACWANRAATRFFGEQVAAGSTEALFRHDDLLAEQWQGFLDGYESRLAADSCWHRRQDGVLRLLNWRFYRSTRSDGAPAGAWLVATDVTGTELTGIREQAAGEDTRGATAAFELDLRVRAPRVYKRMVAAFGLALPGSMRGRQWTDYIHPRDLGAFTEFHERLAHGGDEHLTGLFRGRQAGTSYRWLQVTGWITSRDRRGRARRAIGTVSDVTLSRWEQEERSLRDARALQYEKMEAIGELAGGIAHDFNNTLTTVMGYTELALLEVDQARQKKLATYLKEVYEGGRRARALTAKMLQFSRQEEAHPARFSVAELVDNAVNMLRATLPASVRISVDCDDGLPPIFVDESLLNLLLINVCINASDAMQGVGVIYLRASMRVGMDELCASCHDRFRGDLVELAIEDSGPGISPQIERRIFEPYMSTKQTGSGMGLAVVHGVLHQQHGHLLVDTIVGDGTEFRLYFPPAARAPARAEPLDESPIEELRSDPANHPYHILVVEDEPGLRHFLRDLLSRQGYQVSAAADGARAWEICRTDPARFDLLLTGQVMPGISGLELARQVRKLRPGIAVIMCTAYSEQVTAEDVDDFRFDGYVAKPVDTRKLIELVARSLHSHD